MEVAAGIGQHRQCIMLWLALVDDGAIQLILFPFLLPLLFDGLWVIGNVPHRLIRFCDGLRSRFNFLSDCHSCLIYVSIRVHVPRVMWVSIWGYGGAQEEAFFPEDIVNSHHVFHVSLLLNLCNCERHASRAAK